jgi:hypothetical protein
LSREIASNISDYFGDFEISPTKFQRVTRCARSKIAIRPVRSVEVGLAAAGLQSEQADRGEEERRARRGGGAQALSEHGHPEQRGGEGLEQRGDGGGGGAGRRPSVYSA